MSALTNIAGLTGRILLAVLFIWSGYGKFSNPAGAAQFIQSGGLPGELLVWPVILAELGGGVALALGILARLTALGLAVFTVVATFAFHAKFGDAGQLVHFYKNLAIIGGLLSIVGSGAGPLSVDGTLWGNRSRDAD